MKTFFVRLFAFLAIVTMICSYNVVLDRRDKDDQIAKLSAELEGYKLAEAAEAEGQYKDGIYEGTGKGYGGDVTVQITVENGAITKAEVTDAPDEDPAYLTIAEDLLPDIVDAQSADVDTMTGATFSSQGIIEAASNALEEAAN